jgi:cytochrome c5
MRHLARAAVCVLVCLSLSSCRKPQQPARDPVSRAYDVEPDWNDAQHLIPLNYAQAQGKRVFYTYCVWCHADATPAGPSNRSNLNPVPALGNDGATLNPMSDELLRNTITLGGSAMGKSAMMPGWGHTLSQKEINEVILFLRAIAQPAYAPPARPGPQYNVK